MNITHSLILGLVEGLTEFLPISSTGHLVLTSFLLQLKQSEFLKSFEIIIQLGAILAVLILYWKKFLLNVQVFKKVIIAFIPTALIGLIFYKFIKHYLLSSDSIVLWSLFLGGFFIIIFELFYRQKQNSTEKIENISNQQALTIGLIQSLAMIPGVSRSAATIIGGLGLGLKRKTIVEFSFLLAIPTMIAATSLDLVKNFQVFSPQQSLALLIGFLTAFLVALASIKFLLNFIQKNNFIVFGVYRILVAIIFWWLIF